MVSAHSFEAQYIVKFDTLRNLQGNNRAPHASKRKKKSRKNIPLVSREQVPLFCVDAFSLLTN